ncbi:glycosyltransferase family 4 protein [Pseudomonas sp. 30_B]|uniref:glycosyltransferase family 4 protein n=1 Tax=Pseudomonas sp. 30_B TaxID=2813575 RepID=UPI001FAFD7C8|nr:glycosyltransferase family 4 protein [Pseudomonas sp. 30_B]
MDSGPRIAMIVWNEFRNDARVLKEAQTLRAAGHQVTVFALHTPGVTAERERLESGIEIVRVARSPLWMLRKRRTMGSDCTEQGGRTVTGTIGQLGVRHRALRIVARLWTHAGLLWRVVRHRAAVVHAHDVNTLPTAWLAACLSGARIVYDAHEISTSREGYASYRNLVGFVERLLMPRVHGTITTTDARAKFFARAYGIPRPLVLQNRPRRTVMSSSRIRDELGLTHDWPVVLYQGGLQQGRGLEHLLRAAVMVTNTYFVFIGGGRLAAELQQLSEVSGVQERVHFIPTVSLVQLPSYTASADVGVQPIENTCLNHFTTDSNKLFEYLMAGLPVVASSLPEIRRVVQSHDVGILIPPGDVQALVGALRMMVDDPQLRARMRHNALQAGELLNWEEQESALLTLYRQVLKGR